MLFQSGYTGRLTAEHIATNLPSHLKWAVAGRSESKLNAVVAECQKLNSDRLPPSAPAPAMVPFPVPDLNACTELTADRNTGVEIAHVDDEAQLRALVQKAFVVITTVGPYCLYGEPIFKLCAETGTHYLDCTGEVPWVARMINKYEDTARKSGAIMIPQSGMESAPADLVTWSMAQHLRKHLNAPTKDAIVTIHKLRYVAASRLAAPEM